MKQFMMKKYKMTLREKAQKDLYYHMVKLIKLKLLIQCLKKFLKKK